MTTEVTTLEVQPLEIQVAKAFDKNKAAIADAKKFAELTVEKHGIGKVTAGRVAVKKCRVAVEHRRKALNEDALKSQRAVNTYAEELKAELLVIENQLQAEEDRYEKAKEDTRLAAEAKKRAMLTGRIERLAQAGCLAGDVEAVAIMTDSRFEEHLAAETAQAVLAREEAEHERIEAERLELEKQAEIERQAEELRIRQAELDCDRKAMEAEREAMLHQQQIERRQLEEQQAEVRRQQEEIRAEAERKAETERQLAIAERLAESARLQKIADEEAEAARVARVEALKPEIEKAQGFMKAVDEFADKYLTTIGRPSWSEAALIGIEKACIQVSKSVADGDYEDRPF